MIFAHSVSPVTDVVVNGDVKVTHRLALPQLCRWWAHQT